MIIDDDESELAILDLIQVISYHTKILNIKVI